MQRAIETAWSRQAKSLELPAVTSLALSGQGAWQNVCGLLAPAAGWITAGFAPLDLKDAEYLGDALSRGVGALFGRSGFETSRTTTRQGLTAM